MTTTTTMADEGEEKLIAVARHIARTIGRNDAMADDVLHIFSAFDRRLSPDKLASPSPSRRRALRSLDRRISALLASPSLDPFLAAVDDLVAARRDLDDEGPPDDALLDAADALLRKAMLRLEDDFASLLLLLPRRPSDHDDDHHQIAAIAPIPTHELYQIARRMVAGGFGTICAAAYARSRAEPLEEALSRGGFDARPAEELAAMPWAELDAEARLWTKAAKAAFREAFPGERRLCRRVFGDLAPAADLAFLELCRDAALQLLALPHAVAGGSRAPERLFRVVEIYECLRELAPEIALLFPDPRFAPVRSEATAACAALRAAIRETFAELEDLIRRDPARDPFPGAGVHPITRYVLNYLRAALGSAWGTLAEAMDDGDGGGSGDPDRPRSPLAARIGWIMEILLGNLEARSKLYRDPAQGCVFLMNNVQYVVGKARGLELEAALGEGWLRRRVADVRRWHAAYQRHTWGGLAAALQAEAGNSRAAREAMRGRMRRFAAAFEEVCRAQRGWAVADEQLRAEVRIAAAACVLPAYRSFCARMEAAGERSARLSSEDVEAMIGELFQGPHKKA